MTNLMNHHQQVQMNYFQYFVRPISFSKAVILQLKSFILTSQMLGDFENEDLIYP